MRDVVTLLRRFVDSQPGTEHRPQQEEMARAIQDALRDQHNLVVQAGTGTGKSLAYGIAVAASGRRAVVSTATKQLGEQLIESDLPRLAAGLRKVGGPRLTHTLLKGRANYACVAKVADIAALGAQDPDATAEDLTLDLGLDEPAPSPTATSKPVGRDLTDFQSLLEWVADTDSGDRSDAPPVGEWAWRQVSVTAAECVGATLCPHAADCFAEKARTRAREADITVVNHALLAADLRNPGGLLADHDVLVIDEVHEAERFFSSAWGAELDPEAFTCTLRTAARRLDKNDEQAKKRVVSALEDLLALADILNDGEPGAVDTLPGNVAAIIDDLAGKITATSMTLDKAASTDQARSAHLKSAAQSLDELVDVLDSLRSDDPALVRWTERAADGRTLLKNAPLHVGPLFQQYAQNRLVIATSATCTVGGSFDPIVSTLDLGNATVTDADGEPTLREFVTLDVGSPFDYRAQTMIYVPSEPFPVPVGRDRAEHSAAVLDELLHLVRAAGGRTLFLSTTSAGAVRAADHLRAHVNVPVYTHGEGTAAQLVAAFADDEESVLCGTLGMWAGVNVAGPSLTCVVIDKIPFPPMDDVLTSARQRAADDDGKNGFYEVSVTHAALMLAQGAGRLIRTSTDKGVIAVLDRRLHTKSYGRVLLRSLPDGGVFTSRDTVAAALTRLTGGLTDAAAPRRRPTPRTAKRSASTSTGSSSRRGVVTRTKQRGWGRTNAPITRTRNQAKKTPEPGA